MIGNKMSSYHPNSAEYQQLECQMNVISNTFIADNQALVNNYGNEQRQLARGIMSYETVDGDYQELPNEGYSWE